MLYTVYNISIKLGKILLFLLCTLYISVAQKTESFSDVKLKKNHFLIFFIPRSSDCKKPFCGFSEIFNTQNHLYININIQIWPNKKIRESAAFLIDCAPLKRICACAQCVVLFVHHWSVRLMKSKIVKA